MRQAAHETPIQIASDRVPRCAHDARLDTKTGMPVAPACSPDRDWKESLMKTPKYSRELCIVGLATLALGSLILAAMPAVAQISDGPPVAQDYPHNGIEFVVRA